MKQFASRLLNILAITLGLCLPALAQSDYLPLSVGSRWVLRHPSSRTAVVIEVTGRDADAYVIHFSNPWGANDWRLEKRGSKVYMTGFGQNGQLAPMPSDTLFFDFTASQGSSWKNTIGTMSVSSTRLSVPSGGMTFRNCIQLRQASGGSPIYYAFAPGVGFVQFGDGKSAFTIDLNESKLQRPTEDGPVPHVPGGRRAANPAPAAPSTVPVKGSNKGRLQIGVTTATFANEPQTPENLLKHFEQTVDAGITYISAAQKWTEIEPEPGKYNFEGLKFQVSYAEKLNVPMSVTLRMIDTVDRVLPNDLKRKAWDDPAMERRVMALLDAMAPNMRGRVKWFMFGNEVDGYFGRHPNEIQPFARLFAKVKSRLKQLAPGIQVSSTLMFGGIGELDGRLHPLNDQFEFLSFTYYPIRSDFTMRSPEAPFTDFNLMRQAARDRKVILQEIGYPSSPLNGSSQEMQAQFFENTFEALRQNRDFIEAGNFFLLADLPDKFVKDLAGFYGMPNAKTFLAFLQTLGMFDLNGQPKKSWEIFRRELKRSS